MAQRSNFMVGCSTPSTPRQASGIPRPPVLPSPYGQLEDDSASTQKSSVSIGALRTPASNARGSTKGSVDADSERVKVCSVFWLAPGQQMVKV